VSLLECATDVAEVAVWCMFVAKFGVLVARRHVRASDMAAQREQALANLGQHNSSVLSECVLVFI
jgi:hypothetical protein